MYRKVDGGARRGCGLGCAVNHVIMRSRRVYNTVCISLADRIEREMHHQTTRDSPSSAVPSVQHSMPGFSTAELERMRARSRYSEGCESARADGASSSTSSVVGRRKPLQPKMPNETYSALVGASADALHHTGLSSSGFTLCRSLHRCAVVCTPSTLLPHSRAIVLDGDCGRVGKQQIHHHLYELSSAVEAQSCSHCSALRRGGEPKSAYGTHVLEDLMTATWYAISHSAHFRSLSSTDTL